jgi:hypothetical protein
MSKAVAATKASGNGSRTEGSTRRLVGPVSALLVVAAILVLSYAWQFIQNPSQTAPTRDPAWYTWRTDAVLHDNPAIIVKDWGPDRLFSGGYRVSTPVFGAELVRVAGVGKFSFTVLLAVFLPILASLAIGVFAWQNRGDPLSLFVAALAAGAMFLSTPYVGYMDNLAVIYVLCLMLPFFKPARTSWGARSALFMLGVLATFTHPTTSALFGITLVFIAMVRLVTARFSVAKVLDTDGPQVMSVGIGMVLGIAAWIVGIWGVKGNLKDAALPPPLQLADFEDRLRQWVGTWQPLITGALVIVAIASIVILMRKRRGEALDWYSRISLGWLLPLLGLFGWAAGKAYPYYRFMNATGAWVLLTGMGAWAAMRFSLDRKGSKLSAGIFGVVAILMAVLWLVLAPDPTLVHADVLAWIVIVGAVLWVLSRLFFENGKAAVAGGVVGALVVLSSIGWILYAGATNAQWTQSPWINNDTRVALASAQAYYAAQQDPNAPVVFIVDAAPGVPSYGWSKTFSNMARSGLAGSQVNNSYIYFGHVPDFLSNTYSRTSSCPSPKKPNTKYPQCIYTNMSYDFFKQDSAIFNNYEIAGPKPVVFLVRYFNAATPNGSPSATPYSGFSKDVIDSGSPTAVPLGSNVSLLVGPRTAQPDQTAVDAAIAAGKAETTTLAEKPSLWSHPGHTLRNLLGLFVLLVVPGAIASRWFELKDWPSRIALVPGLSYAMVALSGILVIAVTRSAVTGSIAWISTGLAILVAVVLHLLARRREAGKGKVGPALNDYMTKMFAPLSNFNFAALMGTQFVAQMGDGVVQGSLMKTIAFSGQKGFDITVAPSSHYVLTMILLLYVPYTFISPFIGAAADRFDRRSLLIWSNFLRAALVALAAFALIADKTLGDTKQHPISGVLLIVIVLVTLACTRILLLIKSAGIPVILQGKDLMQGNAVSQAGGAVFQVLGAGIAVVFTKFFAAGLVAIGGATLYVIAALVARNVGMLEVQRKLAKFGEEARRVFRDIWEGLKAVGSRPAAAFGVTSFLVLRSAVFGFVAIVSGLEARLILGGKADKTAVYIGGASAGLGAAIGLVLAQSLRKRFAPHRLLIASLAFIGLAIMVFGGITSKMGFAGLAVASGLGFFVGKIAADTITQQALPDEFRGRGFALFDIMYNLGWIIPAIILFVVYEDSSSRIREIEWAAGICVLIITALLYLWSSRIKTQLPKSDTVDPSAETVSVG